MRSHGDERYFNEKHLVNLRVKVKDPAHLALCFRAPVQLPWEPSGDLRNHIIRGYREPNAKIGWIGEPCADAGSQAQMCLTFSHHMYIHVL
jgi:hypothetical protein